MKKILKSLKSVSVVCKKHKQENKKIGLVVGFDVLHMGHINLFRFAKKRVDILIVGVDNDITLKLTKGQNRPINSYKRRSNFLSELSLVDYIFKINKAFKHGDPCSNKYFVKLYRRIMPTHVFTHKESDSQSNNRKRIAKSLGIKFIPDTTKFVTTTTDILKRIESDI